MLAARWNTIGYAAYRVRGNSRAIMFGTASTYPARRCSAITASTPRLVIRYAVVPSTESALHSRRTRDGRSSTRSTDSPGTYMMYARCTMSAESSRRKEATPSSVSFEIRGESATLSSITNALNAPDLFRASCSTS